jgi:hypothetical protein
MGGPGGSARTTQDPGEPAMDRRWRGRDASAVGEEGSGARAHVELWAGVAQRHLDSGVGVRYVEEISVPERAYEVRGEAVSLRGIAGLDVGTSEAEEGVADLTSVNQDC